MNCTGRSTGSGSGIGLLATLANNCYGVSADNTGLKAKIAIGCFGETVNATGLISDVASSCAGNGSPPYTVTNPYNMP